MISSDTYELQPRLLDSTRTLVIKPDYVEYETTQFIHQTFSRLNKADIADFCQRAETIWWYHVPVGTSFVIRFKSHDGKVLDIRFKSYFGLRRASWHICRTAPQGLGLLFG